MPPTLAPQPACIALGSNLGDRNAYLDRAIAAVDRVRGIRVAAESDRFETEPVGPPGQGPYLNAAALLETSLDPRALLDALLQIESSLGRDRARTERWGPRTIDLDLLLVADRIINEPGLIVPHPHLHERLFVLEPLAQIAAEMIVPTLGRTVASLLEEQRRSEAGQESGLSANPHPHAADRNP